LSEIRRGTTEKTGRPGLSLKITEFSGLSLNFADISGRCETEKRPGWGDGNDGLVRVMTTPEESLEKGGGKKKTGRYRGMKISRYDGNTIFWRKISKTTETSGCKPPIAM